MPRRSTSLARVSPAPVSLAPVCLALAALVIAGLAACSPGGAAPEAADLPKPPSEACLGGSSYESSSMWVETEAGTFDVGLVGEGDVTAIFVHQLDANACGWFLYAADLAAQGGVRAMLLNLCGASESECTDSELTGSGADAVLAAADRAIADGAKRVVVVGASIGGTTAIIAAIRDAEHREAGEGRLDAVADLSGPIASRGVDLRSVAAPIAIPMFLAVAPGDIAVTVDAMTQLAGMVASDQVTLITDGSGHGWDMLNSPGGPSEGTIGEQLADFIRS